MSGQLRSDGPSSPDTRQTSASAAVAPMPPVEELFERRARENPDATALVFGAERLSYGELDASANRLAHRLVREGVGPESLVGIHLERSFELVAAILAVLKTGAAWLPIDPDYPEERIAFLLEDSGVRLVVARAPGAGEIPLSPAARIDFENVRTDFTEERSAPVAARADSSNLAYVIYTSGSTGRPKGTLVNRGNLSWLFSAEAELFDFRSSDVWFLLHSPAFDFSIWEIFTALTNGGRLVIVPAAVARSPEDLASLLDSEGVTVLGQTPAAFYALSAAADLKGRSLRYVVLGGEALDFRRLTPWFDRFGDQSPRLVNMYGITETTIDATFRAVEGSDTAADASLIGRPLPGVDAYIVDPDGRLVAKGFPGELWIGGAGVARSYLNRDELSRERFLDDPFRPGPGRRVYRSGDLVLERPDGDLEFLGRTDDQVKLAGFRVELKEVAAVLSEHPSVSEAVVVSHAGPDGPYLVGYVVPAGGTRFDEAELVRYLRRRLPPYMTCAWVLSVDAFPLTAHGKLDWRALPLPEARPDSETAFPAPRTPTERLVATLFSEATGARRVTADDDFFHLGGHSLAAMRVAARLREVFGVATSPSLLFERPTVSGLTAWVEERRGAPAAADRPIFSEEPRRDQLPLTYAQERVFLLQRLHPEMVAYNFEAAVRFRGRLDPALLEEAIGRLVERHEAFRTTFHENDGRTFQTVHARGPVSLERLDFSGSPPEEVNREIEKLRREIAAKPFDPGRLPLIEWRLVRAAPEEHVLLHREHHLIHDGWSFVVFLRDLFEVYQALRERRPPSFPSFVSLGDYAAAHRRWIEGPAGEDQRRYWRQKLEGAPDRLELPADRVRPAVFSFRGNQIRFDLPADLVAELRGASIREGVTLYMLVLAAFSILASRLAGAEDLCIASGVAGRHWTEIENTVGMLLNNVVFRLRPRGEITVREYLREVREEVFHSLANQDLPFGEIVAVSGAPRSLSETPFARAFFSAYEGPLPTFRLPGLEIGLEEALPNGSAKFDWNVIVVSLPDRAAGERVTVIWDYATDLFELPSMEVARRQFVAAIRSLLAGLDRPLSEVSISDEEERRFLLEAAEGRRTPYPRDATVPELFARQAAERGASIAVEEGDSTLTYAELDRRSESVAASLLDEGLAPEEPVAFLYRRGSRAVTAMLGILKAGGAYMPLSPKDPPARHARLIEESAARFVLAEEAPAPTLSNGRARVFSMEDLLSRPGSAPRNAPPRADSLAAILFTSGSTGRPRGVEVLHRSIVRLLFGADYATFSPEETILQLAPLSFDASTLEIWGALLHGGRLAIFPEDLPTAAALGRAIRRHGVTTMWLNASLFNAIVDEDPAVLEPLRQLLVGGEALSVAHVVRARPHLPEAVLVNGYGPTENTTFSCCHRIPREVDPAAFSIPIGRPIAHSRTRVLDSGLGLLPAGAVGEIFVGGDGLARGYRNLPEATAEAFIPDLFDPASVERLYRTGDLGRVRPDGTLEFRGRRDAQVKIRGFRIEPGEVEAALRKFPGVAAASVQAVEDASRGPSLVAFVVPERFRSLNPAGILRDLARELPPYLLPSRILERPALPMTSHGKVDSAMLVREAREAARMEIWPRPEEAKTALEGVISAAFAEVLGVPDFGADEDFFAAGGHSLLVFRALARLERALGTRIEPAVFLHGPTPRQLAREIERRSAREPELQAPEDGRSVVRVTAGPRPLFFVPGGEGGDLALGVYARLALYLPGTGFYGFRVLRNGSRSRSIASRASSVEELAAGFVEDLVETLSDGPYDLAGGCIGGIVAYEMARQLARAGRPARTLVLLDTIYPSRLRRLRQFARGWSSRARRRALAWLESSPLSAPARKLLYGGFSRLLPFNEHEAPPVVPLEWIRFGDMILDYRPGPLRAKTFLLASRELMRTDAPRRWTDALGGDVTVRMLPGTHWSYIREHIAEVGAALREALEEAPP